LANTVDRIPLPDVAAMRALSTLSLNDDVLELDPPQWQMIWRKGGVGQAS
jgi:hypothetical protein